MHRAGLQEQHVRLTLTGSSGLPFSVNYRTHLTHRANVPQWTYDKTTAGTVPAGPRELETASPACLTAYTSILKRTFLATPMKVTQYFYPRTIQPYLDEADGSR